MLLESGNQVKTEMGLLFMWKGHLSASTLSFFLLVVASVVFVIAMVVLIRFSADPFGTLF